MVAESAEVPPLSSANNELSDQHTSMVPDAAVAALADAALQQVGDAAAAAAAPAVPAPLPHAWLLKESRSQPGYYYYFHWETGITSWQPPVVSQQQEANEVDQQDSTTPPGLDKQGILSALASVKENDASTASKRPAADRNDSSSNKRSKKSKSGKPSKVRVLHILKKHKDCRRPSSWRSPKITISKEDAMEEVQGLMEILQEESGDDLRATFEELARTESDCSSAKRGGDLGYFGPKKMQPAFEEAAFDLAIGQLSGLVYTSSGVHVLLRIG